MLTSPDNPLLKGVRRAVRTGSLTGDGHCVAESFHLLEEALRSGCRIQAVLAAASRASECRATAEGRSGPAVDRTAGPCVPRPVGDRDQPGCGHPGAAAALDPRAGFRSPGRSSSCSTAFKTPATPAPLSALPRRSALPESCFSRARSTPSTQGRQGFGRLRLQGSPGVRPGGGIVARGP